MKSIKFLVLLSLIPSVFAQQYMMQNQQGQVANPPIYPANAGSGVQQNIPSSQQLNASQIQNPQLREFGASVFFFRNGQLVQQNISVDSLKKAAVIFFGDWCPNCHQFLTETAPYIAELARAGIKVILLHVPSADRLRNWQNPTVQEYETARQKVASYGIDTSSVEIVLMGDRSVLSRCGITGLPVFIAVKNSQEFRREIGSNGAAQLRDNNVKTQLMNTWKAGDESTKAPNNNKKPVESKSKKGKNANSKLKKSYSESHPKLKGKQRVEAEVATELLNRKRTEAVTYDNVNLVEAAKYTRKLNRRR